MALVLADRVLETTTTAGSGTITLAGAEPGYQSFSAVGDGNQTYYTIAGDTEWEVGIGTYTASGTTLSRDTVLSSSNSGAKVTFSAGVKKVFVTYPSEKSVNRDVSGNISAASGVITNVASPSAASDAATKLYVDSLVAAGITYHSPVKYEVPNTTGNLNATYNNGTAGVSATLTNAGTLAAFVPDGVTATISDRVLVYNQTNAYENGVYTVTVVGDGSTAWVLTRASDADTYALKSPNSLGEGDAFFVTSGDTGAGETYLCNTTGTIVFGSTAISFVQISSAQVYKAGTGISLTNTTISLVSPVAVATGGTGTTGTPNNGELLIGNGSGYTLSTLTAGSGVSITNSAGSITLSATGLGGTVTAVTATGPLASSGGTTPDISIANSTGTGSVVLENSPSIFSATITAALSASITTITGSSANITTVTGTTAGFSSAAITQLSGTSAGITTVSGTTTTFSSGTITQFGATSATIATVSGTSATYSNGNFTSATVTNASGTNLSYASATITTGNLTFSSTGQRITGDMSNATVASRLFFQNSTTNAITRVGAIPNGTATESGYNFYNTSAATTGEFGQLYVTSSEVTLRSAVLAGGSFLPLTFYTGGSERMRLDTSGNLLLGTATGLAGSRLTIVGGGTQLSGGTTSQEGVRIQRATGYATFTGINNDNNAYNGLQFFTSASAAATIDTSGNVGIGNTVASTINTVNGVGNLVVGSGSGSEGITIYTGTADTGGIAFADGTTTTDTYRGYINYAHATDHMAFWTAAAERMRIDSSGNVGIGVTPSAWGSDTRALQVYTRTSLSDLQNTSQLTNNGYWNGSSWIYIASAAAANYFQQDGAHVWRSAASGTAGNAITWSERMRIDSSGNASIGTTSASFNGATSRLFVQKAGFEILGLNNSNNTNQSWIFSINDAGLGSAGRFNLCQVVNGSTGGIGGGPAVPIISAMAPTTASTTPRIMIDAANKVGINYSPSATDGQFNVNINGAILHLGYGTNYDNYFTCGSSGFQVFRTANTERARFSAAGGFSVGTTADPGAGAIYATGNITAYYSDARLKDFKGKIDGALDKVSQLNGYYYTENAKAEEFGYNNKAMQVGVSAQEVKAVLPEVVSAAPFDLDEKGESKSGENYMTVNYEKLVPLLIEAIKELKAEVEALKAAK